MDKLEAYRKRMGWFGSHEIHAAKQLIVSVFDDLGETHGWRFLGEKWDWFEATFHLGDVLEKARRRNGVSTAARRLFMTSDEAAIFRALPSRITVFRGGCGEMIEAGLSWTLSREKAEWFADHAMGPRRSSFGFARGARRVVIGEVSREFLLGIKSQRAEEEVVVLPGAVRPVSAEAK